MQAAIVRACLYTYMSVCFSEQKELRFLHQAETFIHKRCYVLHNWHHGQNQMKETQCAFLRRLSIRSLHRIKGCHLCLSLFNIVMVRQPRVCVIEASFYTFGHTHMWQTEYHRLMHKSYNKSW